MTDPYSYAANETGDIVSWITSLRALISSETDEIVLTHYRLKLESAREELAKRNAAEIRRRAEMAMS